MIISYLSSRFAIRSAAQPRPSLGFVKPLGATSALLLQREIARLEAKSSQDVFHRDALAFALAETKLARREVATVFVSDRLLVVLDRDRNCSNHRNPIHPLK